MRAGRLRLWIRIEQRGNGSDAAGQPNGAWEEVATVRADPRGQTGMGSITRNQGNLGASIGVYSFRIRFRRGIDQGMRVVELFDGQPVGDPFDIKNVLMDYAGRQWTDLVCEQGGGDG
ncbi:hypothetical protein MyNCGM121_41020 [Achromobacter xylosoxidans]